MTTESEPSSYYLEDGDIVFAYQCSKTSWGIGRRGQRGSSRSSISRMNGFGSYMNEHEAKDALRRYARKNNLRKAW